MTKWARVVRPTQDFSKTDENEVSFRNGIVLITIVNVAVVSEISVVNVLLSSE